MNPSLGTVAAMRLEVRAAGQQTLPGRLWPASKPRALIAVCHGLGEHTGRYNALASELARAGYTVVSVDIPGHGDAGGPRGDVPSWRVLRDHTVHALWTAALAQPNAPDRLPRVLLGHSMGGTLALDYALAHPRELRGVIASAPALKHAMPPWWKLALSNVARVTAPSLGFPTGLDESAMSRDSEVVKGRAQDSMVHDRISPRLYFALAEAQQRVLRDARRLAVPALLIHGSADRVVDPEGTAEFAAAAPKDLVRHVVLDGAYHEVFNEPARDQAIREVLQFVERVIR
jgi:alpha-beta hydrolase superfamily lysophospholipase